MRSHSCKDKIPCLKVVCTHGTSQGKGARRARAQRRVARASGAMLTTKLFTSILAHFLPGMKKAVASSGTVSCAGRAVPSLAGEKRRVICGA